MKTFISIFLIASTVILAACNNNNNSKPEQESKNTNDTVVKSTANQSQPGNNETVTNLITGYLNLKNALTNDTGGEAAKAAKSIAEAQAKVDESGLTPDQKKVYDDVKDDIKEHAEHIGANATNIAHQREHFEMLSKDMVDLVKVTGSTQTLYKDFCPMYNNNKGASWLSEKKEIKNPYLGQKMSTCGEVKEEIKPKG
jgi:hypothetical protein